MNSGQNFFKTFQCRILIVLSLVSFDSSIAHAYEVGIGFGPFLPSRISGVTEVMNGWALRGSLPTPKGMFEIEWYNARGDGDVYQSALFDYRMDFSGNGPEEIIPVHFLLGFHVDNSSADGAPSKFSGGWHYGGGISFPIAGPLLLRADFKHRFSPGNSMIILVGLSLPFGASSPAARPK